MAAPSESDMSELSREFSFLKTKIAAGRSTPAEFERAKELKRLMDEIDARISTAPVDWSTIAPQSATVWITPLPTRKSDLYAKRDPVRATGSVHVKIAPRPFSRGGVRVAYHARVCKSGEATWKPYVVKQFIELKNQTRAEYLDQLETNGVAVFLAKEWMKSSEGKAAKKIGEGIKFIESRALELTATSGGGAATPDSHWYHMEKVVPGKFEKYTDNGGWCCSKPSSRTVLHFTKWSFEYCLTPSRDFSMMATDLQGGKQGGFGWVLTDPAMLCSDLSRFGPTNFDDAMIEICYEAAQHTLMTGGALFAGSVAKSAMRPGFSRTDDGSMWASRKGKFRGLKEEKRRRDAAEVAERRRLFWAEHQTYFDEGALDSSPL